MHVSVTQVSMFMRCPRQWQYRYVEKLIRPPSGALILGSAGHESLEASDHARADEGDWLPTDEVQDRFRDSFTAKVANEDPIFNEGESPGKLLDLGAEAVKVYADGEQRKSEPLKIEHGFTLDIGAGRDLIGFIDLVTTGGTVIDRKFVGKAKSQGDTDSDIQLTAYALSEQVDTGKDVVPVGFDCIVKTKKPKTSTVRSSRTKADTQWFIGMVRDVVRAMDSGIAPPNPNGWHCSKKFCGYWDICKGGAK